MREILSCAKILNKTNILNRLKDTEETDNSTNENEDAQVNFQHVELKLQSMYVNFDNIISNNQLYLIKDFQHLISLKILLDVVHIKKQIN